MKPIRTSWLSTFAVAMVALALARTVSAQLVAYDDAGNYRVSANWTNGSNQGFGFGPWFIATNGPNSHGSYIGSANNPKFVIASVTNVSSVNYTNIWGIYANGAGGINNTAAYRPFVSPLGTNTFKVQWGARGAGATTIPGPTTVHGWCGLTLRNGNDTSSATSAGFESGARFELYFLDGAVPSTVYISDGNPSSPTSLTGVGFSALGRQNITNALQIEVTVAEDGDHYHLVLKDCVQNVTLYTLDSILKGTSGSTLDSVALFCHETTGDQIYNRMQIAVPTLVPPTFANVLPTNGSIYLDPAAATLSFEVDSFNSTVASNFVKVYLNGVQQTNVTFNTTAPASQLLGTCVTNLKPNVSYTYLITAQDANGNLATNTSTFNTWRPDAPFIEAEDYNYSAGSFPPAAFPDTYATLGSPLLGSNGVDYVENDLTGTTHPNAYRTDDLPQIQAASDVVDHAGYAGSSIPDYNLAYTENGEWLNYTRNLGTMGNTNYTVYARMAGFGGNAVMLIERLAEATATTTNQPRAALGTCVCPHTGGPQVYTNVPLTDFFSNPVQTRFPGTNTFRTTCIGDNGSYNLSYLILVPSTNANTLRPYLSAGYPFPTATAVALDSSITVTIANRDTAVNPATIKLLLDATNLTGLTLSNNAAGTVVTCVPTNFLSPNFTHTLSAIFTDNAGSPVTVTNTWQFTTVNTLLTVLPAAYVQPVNSGVNSGFAVRIHKINNAAPTVASLAYAEANLAGMITNTVTSQPYPNEANGGPNADGSYSETGVINYDINGLNTGGVFGGDTIFPYVPANAVNNNIALEALMYMQLTNGNYVFVVRSDDGFKLTAGPTPGNTNLVLGLFDGGRGNGTPSIFYVTVLTNGLYPMRLLYCQAGFGGNVEFYSMNNGTPILINDPNNANSIKTFQALASAAAAVTLVNPGHTGGTTTFSFLTQAGHTHYVEYKNALNDGSWTQLMTIPGNGSITNVIDNTATGVQRFYRVRSQ